MALNIPSFPHPTRTPDSAPAPRNLRRRERARLSHSAIRVIRRSRRPRWVHKQAQIVLPALPEAFDGYRLVHLTDLHFGPAIAYRTVMAGIAHTMELKPDLIVLTGDYVTDHVCDTLLPDALARLTAPDGVWAVLGNHDHWTDAAGVRRVLDACGIGELPNANTCIRRGDESIWLAGVDDIYVQHQDLNAALHGIPDGAPTILLAHEPDFADEAALSGRVSLQLSGHSHGGSFRVPLIGTPVLSSFLKHGRKYPYGLYRPGGMWLYTSAGIGRGRLPRLNAEPEVVEIVLHRRPMLMPEVVAVEDAAPGWSDQLAPAPA
jgi:predicted MPP superfamily phosphohydrolase